MDRATLKEAKRRIENAKAAIVLDSEQPFFASIALNVQFQPSSGLSTFATNYKTIYYNPEYVCKEPEDRIPLCVLHEIMHIVMMHGYRRGERNPDLWNIACDIAINNILKYECKYAVPKKWYYDKKMIGLSAEEIYDRVQKDAKFSFVVAQLGTGSSAGEGEGHSAPSWASGDPNDDGPCPCGTIHDDSTGEGKSMDQMEAEMEGIKSMITQAAAVAKSVGNMPGSIQELVKIIIEPKVDWRALLAEFLTRQCEPDYDWRRPSKRFVPMGVYIPSVMPTQQQGSIAVAVDTSGSISNDELTLFLSELSHLIAQSFISEVHFYQCDADIQQYEVLTKADLPLKGRVTGRGGTDFTPVFDHIRRNDIQIDALIYFTDLYGPWPSDPPPYPVLWAVKSSASASSSRPEYGEVIEIEEEELA